MSVPLLVILLIVAAVVIIGFFALMFSVMSSKRHTGHHGPRAGHADRQRTKRR